MRAAGDEQRGRAVRAADHADGAGGGRAFDGLRPDGAVALARVGNQNRLGGLRVERVAQKREVRGEAAAERGFRQRLRFQRQRGERMLRARVRVRETERVAGRAHREARPGQRRGRSAQGKLDRTDGGGSAAVPWEPRARDDPAERVA